MAIIKLTGIVDKFSLFLSLSLSTTINQKGFSKNFLTQLSYSRYF